MACSCGSSCNNCRKSGGRAKKRYNQGGLLRGPSHERGGMPAIIGGKEPVELEGGEYIIRKSSVDKYGEGTIARINQGLVDPGKLKQLKKGGPVRKMQTGGNLAECLRHRMPDGTIMEGPPHGPNQECVKWSRNPSGNNHRHYNKGGTVNGRNNMATKRKAQYGGSVGGVRRAVTRTTTRERGLGSRAVPSSRRTPTTRRRRRISPNSPAGTMRNMTGMGSYKKGGRARRRFQSGGHTHFHPLIRDHRHTITGISGGTNRAFATDEQGQGINVFDPAAPGNTAAMGISNAGTAYPFYESHAGSHGHGTSFVQPMSNMGPTPRGGRHTTGIYARKGGRMRKGGNVRRRKMQMGGRASCFGKNC